MSGSTAIRAPYWSFALQAGLTAAAVGAAGWWLAPSARGAVIVGALVALAASLIGGLVSRSLAPAGGVTALFGAVGVRLFAVVLFGTVAALAGPWATAPLLLTLAVTHLALLVPDSLDTIRLTRRTGSPEKPPD